MEFANWLLQKDDRVRIVGSTPCTVAGQGTVDFNDSTGTLVEFLTHGQHYSTWHKGHVQTNWSKPNRWVVRLDSDEWPKYVFVGAANLRKI